MSIDFENAVFSLLFILVSINVVVGFANNFIVVGTKESGLPEYFSLNKGEDTYSASNLLGTLPSLKITIQTVISDVSLTSILSFINAFLQTIVTLGALLINLATGYMRLVAIIFSPLNLVTGASGVPIGTYIADMVNIIITLPVIIGVFNWIKGIIASISGAVK